jgi:hypothetical protein
MKPSQGKKEYVAPKLSTHGSVEELTGQKASLVGGLRPPRGSGSGSGASSGGSPDSPFGS